MLVIDDDEPLAEATARFLRLNGYVVAIASSGEDGLREASSVTPNVVLLDHRLGDGMTGLEFLRALRRQSNTRQPAVAVMTADWEVQDGDTRELGAILIHRPCDLDQICDTVSYLSASEATVTRGQGART